MKAIKHLTEEELRDKLVCGEVSVDDLDLSKATQRSALLAAVYQRNSILKKIKGDDAEKILLFILDSEPENYRLFVQLDRAQYTDKLLQMYLGKRFLENPANSAELPYRVQVSKSLDDVNLFTYTYVTDEGDQLNYMDKDVGVPLSLKSSVKITLRLSDASKLIDKLDRSIAYLGAQKIKSELFDVFSSQYKALLGAFLEEKGFGFYSLGGALGEAQEYVKRGLSECFSEYGITVSEFVIRKIAIPEAIQSKVEDLAFAIRQERVEMEAEAELARISLKNYEEKLAVQSKYPETEMTLTEYEKDLALKRYLKKNDRYKNESVDRTIALEAQAEKDDRVIEKQVDVTFEPKKSNFKVAFILALIGALFIAIVAGLASGNIVTSLVMFSIIFCVFGIIGAANYDKLKDSQPSESSEEE